MRQLSEEYKQENFLLKEKLLTQQNRALLMELERQ